MGAEVGVFVCQLETKGGEYEVQVTTVFEVPRTKKGSSQETFGECALSDRLGNCRLSCPGEAVQPEDGGFVEVLGPRLDLIQNSLPRTPEAALAISVSMSSPTSATTVFQYQ